MAPREIYSVYTKVYNAPDISDDASDSISDRVLGEVVNATEPRYMNQICPILHCTGCPELIGQ
jgi:hypothetical protein